MKNIWLLLILVLLLWCLVVADLQAQRELAVTVYNQDFAVVKDIRDFDVSKDGGRLTVADVAAKIDPTSVQITNHGNPRFTVREQNFENDLVSSVKLMAKMIDEPIRVILDDGKVFEGKLLAAEDRAITLQTKEDVKVIERNEHFSQVVMPSRMEGLWLRPTLVWETRGAGKGSERIEITYQTGGMNWNADYNVLIKPEQKLDINGWVTVTNRSGSNYPDAHLILVAGEVHKVQPMEDRMARGGVELKAMAVPEAPPGFQERAFAEYHLYDLGRKTTLAENETKQIELFDVRDVDYMTEYLYEPVEVQPYYGDRANIEGEESTGPLNVVATIENRKENQLGIPLPAGAVRMYQKDEQQVDHFVGQDRIDHTPKDEKVRVTIGKAFDVLGSRRVVSRQPIAEHDFDLTVEIRIRNHKTTAVSVVVLERMMGYMNWAVTQANVEYRKKDFKTIEFQTSVAANSEKQIRYTVRYTRYEW